MLTSLQCNRLKQTRGDFYPQIPLYSPFLLALMPPASLLAQERATIVGTVADSTGAVVPNVKVTVTNDATGVTRILVTNSSGNYSCAAAPYWAILGARRVPGL